jgi:large subunit ribosomal protein L18
MIKHDIKKRKAAKRKARVRSRLTGTPDRPRLTVAKSLKHIYVQIIDDEKRVTLAGTSSLVKEVADKIAAKKMKKTQVAALVGETIAAQALAKGIKKVAFDRNRNLYHGRVKALAEAVRKAGLEF